MRQILLSLSLIVGLSGLAHATNELDRGTHLSQAALAKDLPQTVVVRVPKNDPSRVEVMHSSTYLAPTAATASTVAAGTFKPVGIAGSDSGKAVSELNRDSSTSSWRFYYSYYPRRSYAYSWYYPTYSYYGYNYSYAPYYGYTYDNYYYAYCNYNNGSSYYPSTYGYGNWWY